MQQQCLQMVMMMMMTYGFLACLWLLLQLAVKHTNNSGLVLLQGVELGPEGVVLDAICRNQLDVWRWGWPSAAFGERLYAAHVPCCGPQFISDVTPLPPPPPPPPQSLHSLRLAVVD